MGLRSSDETGDLGPHETMELLKQRGSLRRLVREAMPYVSDPDWRLRAEKLLAMTNWQDYEVT